MQRYALIQNKCIQIYFIHFFSININATRYPHFYQLKIITLIKENLYTYIKKISLIYTSEYL